MASSIRPFTACSLGLFDVDANQASTLATEISWRVGAHFNLKPDRWTDNTQNPGIAKLGQGNSASFEQGVCFYFYGMRDEIGIDERDRAQRHSSIIGEQKAKTCWNDRAFAFSVPSQESLQTTLDPSLKRSSGRSNEPRARFNTSAAQLLASDCGTRQKLSNWLKAMNGKSKLSYESWKLLLEQMKEGDSAQSSNLGQALAPFIASRFGELTQRRNESVQLTAQLGTEGVVAGGAVRSPSLISVGTREQLSTLYRLSLAEYLRTVIVLDDQLVQSDHSRMDWFRKLLVEKARSFQIVVVTCRPSDYLEVSEVAADGKAVHADADGEFIRAVDLQRAVRR